jgi:hypothetical protein
VNAGQRVALSVTVGNNSRKFAGEVTCSFEAVLKDELGGEQRRIALSSGPLPIPESPGVATFSYEIPLHADEYPARYRLSFENIKVDAGAQGSSPPLTAGSFGDLGSPQIRNIKLRLEVRRIESLQGPDGGSGDVSKGDPVYYGLFVRNLGNARQEGALEADLIGTHQIAFGETHPAIGVTWAITPSSPEDSLSFMINDARIDSTSGDWLLGDHVPAFAINTDDLGGKTLQFSSGRIKGHVAGATGGIRNTVAASADELPGSVNVTECSASDLRITLEQDGERRIFAGDSLGIRVRIGFAQPGSLPISGKLTILCTLMRDDFRVLGVQRVSSGPTAGSAEWSELERFVRIESRMLDDNGTGGTEEEWRIRLLRNLGPAAAISLPVSNLFTVAPAWEATGVRRCGLESGVELTSIFMADEIQLGEGRGQIVTFFARPNPATDEVAICYDLLEGVTSVRLAVSDLAGNVVFAARSPGLPLGTGLQVIRWNLKTDSVPNGTYLCKLEVKGADDRGRSLNETRRMKLAVLR